MRRGASPPHDPAGSAQPDVNSRQCALYEPRTVVVVQGRKRDFLRQRLDSRLFPDESHRLQDVIDDERGILMRKTMPCGGGNVLVTVG